MYPRTAFTLVELLVAITVIVILLALLAPAMDRAVYQAELATCMASLRGIATSVQSYAAANKRHYPYRPTIETGYWNRPTNLSDSVVDDRPAMEGYVPMKLLVDPLCKMVDLAGSPTQTHVFSSYNLWFGTYYFDEGRQYAGMKRLGDRLVFQDRPADPNPRTYSFDILAGDYDSMWEYGDYGVFASHPDKAGKLTAVAVEGANASNIGTIPVPAATSFGFDVYTLSRWQFLGSPKRGLMDTNFAYGDGSVQRFEDVEWDDWRRADARMYYLPVQTRGGALGSGYPLYWDHIPLR